MPGQSPSNPRQEGKEGGLGLGEALPGRQAASQAPDRLGTDNWKAPRTLAGPEPAPS